jgi:hypothetical protein
MPFTRIGIATIACALLASTRGEADEPKRDPAVAQALFAEARKLMAAGDFASACPKFADSEALDPAPGTALNLAACFERAGKMASAWAAYETAEAVAQQAGQRDRAAVARKRAASLETKLSRLTVQVPPAAQIPGLEVRVDGELLGAAEWGMALPRDGGAHEVAVLAPGKKPWKSHVDVADSGQNASIEVPALSASDSPVAAASPAAATPAPAAPPVVEAERLPDATGSPSHRSPQRTAGIVVGAVGLAGVVFGAVAGLEASSTYSSAKDACGGGTICPAGSEGLTKRATAGHWATASTIGFIAGGVVGAAGVVLFLTAPHGAPGPVVGIGPASQGTGLSVAGEF